MTESSRARRSFRLIVWPGIPVGVIVGLMSHFVAREAIGSGAADYASFFVMMACVSWFLADENRNSAQNAVMAALAGLVGVAVLFGIRQVPF